MATVELNCSSICPFSMHKRMCLVLKWPIGFFAIDDWLLQFAHQIFLYCSSVHLGKKLQHAFGAYVNYFRQQRTAKYPTTSEKVSSVPYFCEYPLPTSRHLYLSTRPSFWCLTLNTYFDPLAFRSLGSSPKSHVSFSISDSYSKLAASCHSFALGLVIASFKVLGSV